MILDGNMKFDDFMIERLLKSKIFGLIELFFVKVL